METEIIPVEEDENKKGKIIILDEKGNPTSLRSSSSSLLTSSSDEEIQNPNFVDAIKEKGEEIIEEIEELKTTEPTIKNEAEKAKNVFKKESPFKKSVGKIQISEKSITKLEKLQVGFKKLIKKATSKEGIYIIIGILAILGTIIAAIKIYQHYHLIEKHHPNEKLKIDDGKVYRVS